MTLTLYSVSDGPPSVACRMCLKMLKVKHTQVDIDYAKGGHMTEEYALKNPQKEIPVLDDDGFYLSESNAILQYLADKYGKDDALYPKDLKTRAVVNHRLCFNLSTYYKSIIDHVVLPIFYDFERNETTLKRMKKALDVFSIYLNRQGTKYAATDNVTIADLQFCASTMCLEAINFELSPWPRVSKWYATFKAENPELWTIAEGAMKELAYFEKNSPDLTGIANPLFPLKKLK